MNVPDADWLAAQARAKPDAVALTFRDEAWAYRALHEQVDGLCAQLAALHLPRNAIVAAHLANSPTYVMLIHALARLGHVLAPLNTRLTAPELSEQLDHLRCACLICDDTETAHALSNGRHVLLLSQLASLLPEAFESRRPELQDVQAIVFTSGSTGAPKGVELTFANHFFGAVASAFRLGTQPDDAWLCCLPLYHVGGLAIVMRSCLYGTAVALHERFDLDAVNRALDSQPITLISLVPTMLKRLLDTRASFPSSLRLVLIGGAAADEALLAECARRDVPVAPTYGLTEAASQVATMTPRGAARKPGCVGKPLMFTQVRIADERGATMPPHQVGEIVVRGPTVMRGYIRNAEATEKALRSGELYTADLGYMDDDGDLWLVQRRSDMIVTGGENVYPAEVERVLRQHPAVGEVAVIGLSDVVWGQRVAAAVVLKPEQQMSVAELDAYARTMLAGYKLPREICFVQRLPVLPNGKLDRFAVREFFA